MRNGKEWTKSKIVGFYMFFMVYFIVLISHKTYSFIDFLDEIFKDKIAQYSQIIYYFDPFT